MRNPPINQYRGTLISDMIALAESISDIAEKQRKCDELDAIYVQALTEMIQKELENGRDAN